MHEADADAQLSITWGIVVGLLASFVQSLGLTIQRKSHVLNQQLAEADQRADHRRPLWLLGFAIFISSNVLGSLFQIASLPVVILAPLGAVSLLWNAFFARLLLGDVFSLWMLLGTILIAGGAVLIAIFGIVPEPTHSLEDLLLLFERPAFIAYFSILGVAVLLCLVATHITEFSLARNIPSPLETPPLSPSPRHSTIPPAVAPPPSHVILATEETPLLDRKPLLTRSSTPTISNDPKIARTRLLLAVSFASVSGILSGMCLLIAKSGVELLILTIGGKNQFWRWEAWMLLVGLIAFALLQLWYLQKSLVYADPTIVCPLAFCFYNLSSIVNGLVYFNQFALLSALNLSLVSLGMVILLGGVWLVSFHAGSGRVDVGTWQEGDDGIEEDSQIPVISESYPSPLYSPMSLESTVSESGIARFSLSPPHASQHTMTFPSTSGTDGNYERLSHSLTLSPSTSSSRRRRRFSLLHPTDTAAPPLPGGGFSIGLSPVSPGFAIVPKRRINGLRGIVQRATMRRTVSENDVDDEHRRHDSGLPRTDPVEERCRRVRSKARWKWLRSVFTDRDS